MLDFLPMKTRTRVVLGNQVTGTGAQAYLAPSAGVKAINIRCVATMGNSADLVLSLKYADDAAGTNAAAFSAASPIFKDGVAQTAAKTLTIGDATGSYIVDFIVDPALIPEGKLVGVSYANSHNSSLLSVTMVEDVAYMPTVS